MQITLIGSIKFVLEEKYQATRSLWESGTARYLSESCHFLIAHAYAALLRIL